MRKCGFHVQRTDNTLRQAIASVQPTVIVSLAHDYSFWRGVQRDHPGILLIGRRYEEGMDWREVDPRWWAEQCAALEMPYDAFITWNEPTDVYNDITLELAARHDDWCCQFKDRINELGYHAVALNVPTGHFHRNAVVNLFPNICQSFQYIGLHEYSARAMWDQDPKKQRPPEKVPQNEGDMIGHWYCQRYRDWHDGIVARWPERAGQFQAVVTECGVAYGVIPGFGDVGWQTDLSVDQYMASLRWYFGEMNQDDYCLGGAIFMMGFADHKWASFETLDIWQRLLEIPEAGETPEPPPENGGDEMDIKVIDLEYNERDFGYAESKYGVAFRRAKVTPGQKVYRLVELWEKTGHSSLITKVLGEDGEPVHDMDVAFYWRDAPPNEADEIYPHDWHGNFVHGLTNAEGEVGPGMGSGAYHGEGEGGPHAVWVRDMDIPSDICEKLGMLAGTFHDHLDQVFRLTVEGDDGNGPTPEPGEGQFVEVSRAFQEEGNNRILVIAQGDVDFYETRASIRVKDTGIDMGPFHPDTLTKYNLTVDYEPGEGEESRVFVVTIERPDGEIVSDRFEFPYETGRLGWWTVLVEWEEPVPPPDDEAAIHQMMAVAHGEVAKAHAVLAECHAKLAK